jgi:hypothetical protein
MTSSIRTIASSLVLPSPRALHWLPVVISSAIPLMVLLMVLLAILPGPADARVRAAGAYASAYDGIWNVVFATTRGNCSSGYSVPFTVAGSRVSSAGGGRVSGSVGRGGSVAVNVSVGASKASGGGRLAGNGGAGSWRGTISGDLCSGTWQATRG